MAKSIAIYEGHMSKVRNILISFGVFWLSLWVAWILQWPSYDRLINAVVRDETVLSAVAMGVMSSMGRTFAAVLAGVLVTVVAAGRKSHFWALIVAVLYVVDAPVLHHWGYAATAWDRLWQSVDLLFPAIACILGAVVIAHFRAKGANS